MYYSNILYKHPFNIWRPWIPIVCLHKFQVCSWFFLKMADFKPKHVGECSRTIRAFSWNYIINMLSGHNMRNIIYMFQRSASVSCTSLFLSLQLSYNHGKLNSVAYTTIHATRRLQGNTGKPLHGELQHFEQNPEWDFSETFVAASLYEAGWTSRTLLSQPRIFVQSSNPAPRADHTAHSQLIPTIRTR